MDLRARLRSWALDRPRVLLVDAPGEVLTRWSVEAELDRRGWRRALSPADADLLVVVGEPGPELAAAVDVLWSQIAEPRHRVDLDRPAHVSAGLDDGRRALVQRAAAGADSADRPAPASLLAETSAEGMDHGGGHEGMDHGGGHEGMDHGGGHEGMDHGGGHEGMDHGGGPEGMDHDGEVAGLPMASTAPDRDGLELDVLRVTLGPVLTGWPTGLILRAELQGDVLRSAEPAWLDAGDVRSAQPPPDPRRMALDRLAGFLDVAGWPTAARDARRARDRLAASERGARREAERLAAAVARRVSRSRSLSWTAGGIGPAGAGHGLEPDVLGRVRTWCAAAAGRPVDELPATSLDDVAALVEGAEIGSARLIVAGLVLQPEPARPVQEAVRA